MSNYESHNLENESLPFIYREGVSLPAHRMPASSNWHENVELLYITGGEGRVWDNGRAIPVRAGDLAVFNANHLHALAASAEEMHYRYLIVDRAFCLSNGFDSTALSFRTPISDAAVRARMEALEDAYRDRGALRTLRIRTAVLELLLLLCAGYASPAPADAPADKSLASVKQALAYIRASYSRDFSLEEVADFVGVNKFYLSREFHKYTGYRFVAYVNLTRCRMAQRLLSDPHLSVSEVGRRCGFENRSYFARSFRRYVGVLPGEYRAKAAKAAEAE